MSKIRLHGSSSGYTEIAPVAASGNNTLTLPNDGTIISKDSNGAVGVTSITVGTGVTIGDGKITCDGSALTSINAAQLVGVCTSGLTKTGGFGKILQAVQTVKTDTTSINSTTMAAISGLSVDITPSSTSSKILVIADVKIGESGTATQLRLMRDSSSIYTGDNAGANFNDISWSGYGGSDTGQGYYGAQPVTLTFLDSPSTTSQVTYAVHWCRQNNAIAYLNKTGNDASVYSTRLASSILAMEVAA